MMHEQLDGRAYVIGSLLKLLFDENSSKIHNTLGYLHKNYTDIEDMPEDELYKIYLEVE